MLLQWWHDMNNNTQLYCIAYGEWYLRNYSNSHLDWTIEPQKRLLLVKSEAETIAEVIEAGSDKKLVQVVAIAPEESVSVLLELRSDIWNQVKEYVQGGHISDSEFVAIALSEYLKRLSEPPY